MDGPLANAYCNTNALVREDWVHRPPSLARLALWLIWKSMKSRSSMLAPAMAESLNLVCVAVALSGQEVSQFLWSMLVLGVGWNFLFTGSTTLSMTAWRPEEKDRAQAAINFCVFATMAVTSFASGALVTTSGWDWLNYGSLVPVALTAMALLWLVWVRKNQTAASSSAQ